jgi:predicted transposase/invertase (TIGR01784 family)
MKKLLSPKVDFVFKSIFGQERNKPILLSLINAVLDRDESEQIAEIEILNTEITKDSRFEKGPILDLKVKDKLGRLYDIEIQCKNERAFVERIIYYWARIYGAQLQEGSHYHELHPVISIVFTDFTLFSHIERYHTLWGWREVHSGEILSNAAQIHFIELPKYNEMIEKTNHPLEKWISFFNEGDIMTREIIEKFEDPSLLQAYDELQRLSRDPAMHYYYESYLKSFNDRLNQLYHAEQKGL